MNNRITSSRPQYTAEEINASYLPGFTEPADMYDIFLDNNAVLSRWQPVLSATIVSRLDGDLHVLTGRRTAQGNVTHVDVASTPTIRIPTEDVGALISRMPFCLSGAIDPLRPFVSESLYPSVASLPDNTDVLASRVGYLLALKLQLGTVLETAREPIGRTSVARCIAGFSYIDDDPSGQPLYEPLIMIGSIVGLYPEAAKQIPKETTSYGQLGWTPVEQYVRGVKTRNVADVIRASTPADELEVCVRGLCNATSLAIVSDANEIQNHLTEEYILDPM